jgi:plasmid stabilization system protein ParE
MMISKSVRLIKEAQTEHEQHYDDLFDHSVAKAERYRAEILKGLLAIAAKPDGYGYVPGYDFRSYGPTRKEKYRIAYVETAHEIIVIAIYYGGAPDPLYWVERAF